MKTKNKINTVTVELPAHWASYLVNGDSSGLVDYHGESLEDVQARLASAGVKASQCVDVSDPFDATDDVTGLFTSMATYTFQVVSPVQQFQQIANILNKATSWINPNLSNGEVNKLSDEELQKLKELAMQLDPIADEIDDILDIARARKKQEDVNALTYGKPSK